MSLDPFLAIDTEFTWDGVEPVDRRTGEIRFPHPPLAHIAVIGFCSVSAKVIKCGVIAGETERDRVAKFVDVWERSLLPIVTFNGRSCDVPLIFARCMHYGIPAVEFARNVVFTNRYRSPGHIDLYDQLGNYGAQRAGGLDDWARCVGWPGKLEMDGSKVGEALRTPEGRRVVEAYCIADAVQTAAVRLRFDLVTGALSRELYLETARRLITAATPELSGLVDISNWLLGESRQVTS